MKRLIVFLNILLFFSFKAFCEEIPSTITKESIFAECNKLKSYDEKIEFLNSAFDEHISEEWAVSLPQMSLTYAKKNKDSDGQLNSFFNIIKFYQYRGDIKGMEKYFLRLRRLSYLSQSYDVYFNTWNFMIELYLMTGETERSFLEINRMMKEANELKSGKGILTSYITLGDYYSEIGNYAKSLLFYGKALKQKSITSHAKVVVYDRRAEIFFQQKRYNESLQELYNEQKEIYKTLRSETESKATYNSMLFGTELFLCEAYYALNDMDNFKKHYHKATLFSYKNSFLPYNVRYHEISARYYAYEKKWNQSLKEYDLALKNITYDQSLDRNSLLRDKANALFSSGNYKDAFDLYKYVSSNTDSLTRSILAKNEKVHEENKLISDAILKGKDIENKAYFLFIIIVSIFIIAIFVVIYKLYIVGQKLQLAQVKIKEECIKVEKENKNKEKFLKNIDFDIRTPLNAVVGLSNVLCEEKDLTEDEKKSYSNVIKENSDLLMKLIFNILDFSRLEAGMMKFVLEDCDAVRLCKDSKMLNEIRNGNKITVNLHSEMESALINTDSSHFIKMISSLLEPINGYSKENGIDCKLMSDSGYLVIKIKGSPLLTAYKIDQEHKLQNNINKLFTQTFKGSYIIDDSAKEPVVTIKYPLKNE